MIRIGVVLISFILVWFIEQLSISAPQYYAMLTLSCMFIIFVCSALKDEILICYAILQLTVLFLYACMLYPTNMWAENLLYNYAINFSIILHAFECFILVTGIANALGINNIRQLYFHSVSGKFNDGDFEAMV